MWCNWCRLGDNTSKCKQMHAIASIVFTSYIVIDYLSVIIGEWTKTCTTGNDVHAIPHAELNLDQWSELTTKLIKSVNYIRTVDVV